MTETDSAETPIEIEDIGSNPDPRETIGELIERRLTRRAGGAAMLATGLVLLSFLSLVCRRVPDRVARGRQAAPGLAYPGLAHPGLRGPGA